MSIECMKDKSEDFKLKWDSLARHMAFNYDSAEVTIRIPDKEIVFKALEELANDWNDRKMLKLLKDIRASE